jgi:hypothetical protein
MAKRHGPEALTALSDRAPVKTESLTIRLSKATADALASAAKREGASSYGLASTLIASGLKRLSRAHRTEKRWRKGR